MVVANIDRWFLYGNIMVGIMCMCIFVRYVYIHLQHGLKVQSHCVHLGDIRHQTNQYRKLKQTHSIDEQRAIWPAGQISLDVYKLMN